MTAPGQPAANPVDRATRLAKLVGEMRAAQREYFSTRNPNAMTRAKILERRIDQAVEKILEPQQSLDFGEDDA